MAFAEESNACFLGDDRILIASSAEDEDPSEVQDAPKIRLLPRSIACFDLQTHAYLWNTRLESPAGTLMPAGEDHVFDFYDFPKLIEFRTGHIVRSWEEVKTGRQSSSIIWGAGSLPPLALDTERIRFATVDSANMITVIRAS